MATKKAILILGTHRSGTSAITRTLASLGAQLSPDLIARKEDNEKGFWEPENVLQTDDEILSDAGLSWFDIAPMPEAWWQSPDQAHYLDRAVSILESDFADASLFVLKEPRMCRLVPFWLEALAKVGASPHIVIPLRNPSEVAASLKARDGFSNGRGMAIWLRDLLDVEEATRGLPRSFIHFADLLSDWRGVIDKIEQDLSLSWPVEVRMAEAEIDGFISAGQRNFDHEALGLESHPDANPWVRAAYAAFKTLAMVGSDEAAEQCLDQIRGEFNPACKALGPLLDEADRLASREGGAGASSIELPGKLASSEQSNLAQWLGSNFADVGQKFTNVEALLDRFLIEMRERKDYINHLHHYVDGLKQKISELEGQHDAPVLAIDNPEFEEIDLAAQIENMKRVIVEKDYHIYQQDLRIDRLKEEAADLHWQVNDLEDSLKGNDGRVRWHLSFPLPTFSGFKKSLDFSLSQMPSEQEVKTVATEKEVEGYDKVKSWPGPSPYPKARTWYNAETPRVSIIILNFNKPVLTRACLQSLWTHTEGFPYEIILVDNGSRLEVFDQLQQLPGDFRLIRLQENRYFGEGNNIGFEASKGEFVIFMNNDVTVTPNWLGPLMGLLTSTSEAGAVAPKFVYPDGRLQEAGALLDEDGVALQLGKGRLADDPQFTTTREVTYCSAATVLMRRKVFEQVMGFDLIWDPAYYEDTDLCLKIAQIGLKTFYCAEATVVHHENATTADHSHGLALHNIVEINRQKFLQRWLPVLRGDTQTGVELRPVGLPGQASNLPIAALYLPYNLMPGGGERYALTMAESLFDQYQVYLITPERYSRLRLMTLARELGLDLSRLQMCTMGEIDSIRPIALFISMANDVLPQVPIEGYKNFYHCQFPFPMKEEDINERKAGKFLDGYDGVLVNSEFTRAHYVGSLAQQKVGAPKVHVLNPPVDLISSESDVDLLKGKENVILNVGRFFRGGHCKHQDLMIEAFKKLQERTDLDLELHFVGALHPEAMHRDYFLGLKEMAEGLPIFFHLNLAPEGLEALYRRARMYWHATGAKSNVEEAPYELEHFGISIVEAMSAGCIPAVFNQGGPVGIVDHKINGFHWANIDELVSETARVYADPDGDWVEQMQVSALQKAQIFSKQAFVERFRSLVLEQEPTQIAAQ